MCYPEKQHMISLGGMTQMSRMALCEWIQLHDGTREMTVLLHTAFCLVPPQLASIQLMVHVQRS